MFVKPSQTLRVLKSTMERYPQFIVSTLSRVSLPISTLAELSSEMFSVGLFIYPSLFPQEVQLQLLAKSFHRDLSIQEHQTNVHMFHHVQYPPNQDSYFADSATDLTFEPKDERKEIK